MKKVLVVDDEQNLLDMLVEFCENIDVTPIPADTIAAALAKAVSEKPDAITIDNRLPDGLGMDAIVKLKTGEATKHIPVILLSGDAKMIEAEALRRGAAGVLEKPVKMAAFKQALVNAMGEF
jgi:CheY-like chemotaxis protein